jgi:REP element-mobilizing transposase RayT
MMVDCLGMRQGRLKAPPSFPVAYYHCLSRIVDRQFLLGAEEKEQFVAFMREYEQFCGVRVLTYCVMSNHFHLLIEVPERPMEPLTDEALIRMLARLSGINNAGTVRQQLAWFREREQGDAAEALRERILSRMWDISAFMKLLKQRFSQWYNRRKGRRGTLWEERFRSVLVEGAVLGTRGFVNGIFRTFRERFGPRRRDGARRMKGVRGNLYSLRALRIGPVQAGFAPPACKHIHCGPQG